jgi:hypothetical protein
VSRCTTLRTSSSTTTRTAQYARGLPRTTRRVARHVPCSLTRQPRWVCPCSIASEPAPLDGPIAPAPRCSPSSTPFFNMGGRLPSLRQHVPPPGRERPSTRGSTPCVHMLCAMSLANAAGSRIPLSGCPTLPPPSQVEQCARPLRHHQARPLVARTSHGFRRCSTHSPHSFLHNALTVEPPAPLVASTVQVGVIAVNGEPPLSI